MEINSADKVTVSGVDEAECLATMVEIKIKTLDSQTYTLRVNKCMPIPALKEQIATVTGVLSEQQRLICRGKVLKDDQLLSAYHVEDGHTLHLVVRQPFHSSSSSPIGSMGSESTRDHLADPSNATGRDRGNHVTQNVVLGTFNVADQGDGIMPDLSRIISAVLGSIGIGNIGSGSGVIDHREHGVERLNRGSGARGSSDSTQPPSQQTAPQAHLDPLRGSFYLPTSASLGSMPPTVIPDSLMTLSHYLSHMKREFDVIGRSHISDSGYDIFHGMEGQGQSGGSQSGAGQGLPTPASLAEVIQLTRQTLIEQAGGCLSQLARQLEDQGNVTDHPARMNIQSNAIRSGVLLQNLGALLLELGRTTMTLRMGHTPAEAVVNAGPAVFISTAGPNPILVQPLPFQPGTSFGRSPMETAHPGHGLGGGTLGSASDLLQRNIDIRIRTGPLLSTASTGRGERAGAREPPGQSDPAISGVNLAQQPVSGASGSPSFTGESGVRVVPVRTVVATVPAALSRPPSDSAGSAHGLFYPLLARFPHLSSGNMNDTRGSQAPSNNHPSGPGPAQQQVPSPAGHQQNLGSNTRREGNSQMINFPPAIAASVVSNINPPANTTTQHQEGDGSHDAQESTAQVPSRFDQLLRTIFSGEQIHASEINLQASATGSTMDQMETNRRDEVNESSRVDMDPGVLFSSLLQQIMPLISQTMPSEVANASSVTADTAQNDTESNSLASQTEREILSEVGGSHSCRDPPSPPSSKRQKRE